MIRTENGERLLEFEDVTDRLVKAIAWNIEKQGTCGSKRGTYMRDFFTMDIESSTIGKNSDTPIAFAYSIAVYIDNTAIMFRRWKDYLDFISRLTGYIKLDKNKKLVCYIHNLPYEFQFMRTFMNITDVFATQKRKVVKCRCEGIEYRCSYKLTNLSLEKFTDSIPNIKHPKLEGEEFDYSKLRTPKTEITPKEADYIFNDVAGLYEAIGYTIQHDNLTIGSIPLTSTGFVRNELRKAMNENPKNRANMLACKLDQYTYGLLREARRGGNTHCSPIWSNMELENLMSMDMSSAYPAVMIQCKFPVSKFIPVKYPQQFEKFIGKYACILDISFDNIMVNTLATVPYIAKAKCTQLRDIVGDNGRVLSAERLSMVITDIDYQIIKDTYTWRNVECRACLCADYGYLPDELRKLLLKQYYDKTTLKDKDEYLYNKQKNKFNANFGCMLTDICQDSVSYDPESEDEPFKMVKDKDYTDKLEEYYKNKSSFLQYQHGVWVTAHCRRRLQKAISGLKRDMVYCDTDSTKFFVSPVNRLLFDKLNAEIMQEIQDCGLNCTVTYKGKDYTLGIWEEDGDYKVFKSMGAKKYAYIDNIDVIDGKKVKVDYDVFHITVAGLSKSKARKWLEQHGGMKAFKVGTVVPPKHSGRSTAKYNDWTDIRLLKIDGEVIEVGANLAIVDSTYEFGISEDYENLLSNISEGVMF